MAVKLQKMETKQEQEHNPVEDIKFALPDDLPQVVAFGYKSFDDNGLKGYGTEPSFNKTVLNVQDWMVNHAVLVKRNEDNDKLIDGVIALQTTDTWWSEDAILYVTLFYIPPEKRTFSLAVNLLKAAQEYAIMLNIPLYIDLVGNFETKRKAKLFKYAGFEEFGTSFVFTP